MVIKSSESYYEAFSWTKQSLILCARILYSNPHQVVMFSMGSRVLTTLLAGKSQLG